MSAKSMVGLDSIQFIPLLFYTMYLDISKVYGWVRLKPVLSAIDCILCIFIVDYGFRVLPVTGRLVTEK